MSEVKKIATRESYGNALAELGAQNPNIVVLDADLQELLRLVFSKKHSRSVTLTVVSLKEI